MKCLLLWFLHQKRIWGPKLRHWWPLPKTLHKRNVLGQFFELHRRKNQFWTGKERFSTVFYISLFWSGPCCPGRLKNINIPIGISRFPARAGQGPLRIIKISFWSEIPSNFMKSPTILVRIQYLHWKSDSGVPGEEYERCNHWKSIGITVIFACQRCRAENWWNERK